MIRYILYFIVSSNDNHQQLTTLLTINLVLAFESLAIIYNVERCSAHSLPQVPACVPYTSYNAVLLSTFTPKMSEINGLDLYVGVSFILHSEEFVRYSRTMAWSPGSPGRCPHPLVRASHCCV